MVLGKKVTIFDWERCRNSAPREGRKCPVRDNKVRQQCCFIFRDAIEFLSSEGHIYSTIDDDHYKATDS